MLVTGVMYSSEATVHASAAFWIKMVSLLLAMIFTYTVKKHTARDIENKLVGALSILWWLEWPGEAVDRLRWMSRGIGHGA
jgi:hypothetical protein